VSRLRDEGRRRVINIQSEDDVIVHGDKGLAAQIGLAIGCAGFKRDGAGYCDVIGLGVQ
jgi:hypothetical protein